MWELCCLKLVMDSIGMQGGGARHEACQYDRPPEWDEGNDVAVTLEVAQDDRSGYRPCKSEYDAP